MTKRAAQAGPFVLKRLSSRAPPGGDQCSWLQNTSRIMQISFRVRLSLTR